MSSSVFEQIAGLERERSRLEGRLAADENWHALVSLQALNGSGPPDAGETEQRLRRTLAANPYYSARVKIVEAITILRRLNDVAPLQVSTIAVSGFEIAPKISNAAHSMAQLGTPRGVPLLGDEPKASRAVQNFRAIVQPEEPAAPAGPVSDFIRIRGIAPETAVRLVALGTTRYSDIAGWTTADVRRVTAALELGRRISKENWIEQAALLARAEAEANVPVTSPVEPPSPDSEVPGAIAPPLSEAEAQVSVPDEPVETAGAESPPELQSAIDAEPDAVPKASVERPTLAATESKTPPLSPDTPSPKEWLAKRRVGWSLPPSQTAQPLPVVPPPIPVTQATEVAATPLPAMVPAVADRTSLGEAEVVITGRSRKTNDAAHLEASSLRSLRKRLLGMPKTAEIDAASHAGYLDNVEEASVEIVRACTEGVTQSHNLGPSALLGTRKPAPTGLVSRLIHTLKPRD